MINTVAMHEEREPFVISFRSPVTVDCCQFRSYHTESGHFLRCSNYVSILLQRLDTLSFFILSSVSNNTLHQPIDKMTRNNDRELKVASLNAALNLVRGAVDSIIHQEQDVELQREWLQTLERSLPLTLSNVITHYRGPSNKKSRKRKIEELKGSLVSAEALCEQRTKDVLRHRDELGKILVLVRKAARHPVVRKYRPLLEEEADQMDATWSPLSGPIGDLLALIANPLGPISDRSPDLEKRTRADCRPGQNVTHTAASKASSVYQQVEVVNALVTTPPDPQCKVQQQQPKFVECTDQEALSPTFVSSIEQHAE